MKLSWIKVNFWGYEFFSDQQIYNVGQDLIYHGSKRSQENYDLRDKGRDTLEKNITYH